MHIKVAAGIQKLEQEGIIEKVSGPTEWVSRIVTPHKLKSPNEIRLSVDMRDANRTILMTRHISPTIDELTVDLNGATAFIQQARPKIRVPPARASSVMQIHHYILHPRKIVQA